MSRFAFHRYNAKEIYEINSGLTAASEICAAEKTILSLAHSSDGAFYIVDRGGSKTIWKHYISGVESSFYQHPLVIRCVRTRNVNNQERVYFIALRDGSSADLCYLDSSKTAISYYLIDSKNFLIPDPCSPGSEFHWGQPPTQFAFDSHDNLYLTLDNTTPSGIWKIPGAGPAGVTGTISRIYSTTTGSINGLCCDGSKLYFHGDDAMIYSFDPVTHEVKPFFDTVAIATSHSMWDSACKPETSSSALMSPLDWIRSWQWFWPWAAVKKWISMDKGQRSKGVEE